MQNRRTEDYIIYEDEAILVCHKPAGMAVQSAGIGSMDLESALKNYLAQKKPGKMPYLGIVHRLDQPVEGVVVFAKNQQAAKDLSRQISMGQMEKYYLAVTAQEPPASEGTLEDYLKKDGRTNTSAVTAKGTPGARAARLAYKVLDKCFDERGNARYLLGIHLDTGRHHQIRVQMAHVGMPLLGDRKYNPSGTEKIPLALCSGSLEFFHPTENRKVKYTVIPAGEGFRGFSIEE